MILLCNFNIRQQEILGG